MQRLPFVDVICEENTIVDTEDSNYLDNRDQKYFLWTPDAIPKRLVDARRQPYDPPPQKNKTKLPSRIITAKLRKPRLRM